jgi:hypothetical protein
MRAATERRPAHHHSLGSTSVYLTGPVGAPNTGDASLANPVRMRETNLGNLFNDALFWWYNVRRCRAHAVFRDLCFVCGRKGC